jgi:transcriptional regulator GlxA family with amidase domain
MLLTATGDCPPTQSSFSSGRIAKYRYDVAMHTVVVLALQGAIPFDLAIPFQVFGDAATAIGEPLYQVSLAARRRGPLTTSEGFSIIVPRGLSALAPADTIVVIGSEPPGAGTDDDVLSALRRAKRRGVRLLSICTGAFVLFEFPRRWL